MRISTFWLGIILSGIINLTLPLAHGQRLQTLHSFLDEPTGFAEEELVEGSDGYLYGTTPGTINDVDPVYHGTVFKINAAGQYTMLMEFNEANGRAPVGLVKGSDSDFYGATRKGGSNNFGTLFKITTNGTFTTVFTFSGTNGASPNVLTKADDVFFGTTYSGRTDDGMVPTIWGTVFRMTAGGELTTLFSFQSTNGSSPTAGLMRANDGYFYGTTMNGGLNGGDAGWGTIFKISESGEFTSIYSFDYTDGANPRSELIQGNDGQLYGTTIIGGIDDSGTVFKITTNGIFTTVFFFNGTNGANPFGRLLQGTDGCIYGTTVRGGAANRGTVFRLTTEGALTTLETFDGSNGSNPEAGLTLASDGCFYGTTSSGGMFDNGTVFRIEKPVVLTSRVSANEMVLSWPTNALGFTLQSAVDLNSPTNWTDHTNSPAVLDAHFVVTNSISNTTQFYRLKK